MEIELKPCPFCGSTKLDYSSKTSQSSTGRTYHVVVYCRKCRAYGPRVLVRCCDIPEEADKPSWLQLINLKHGDYSDMAKAQAAEKWNERTYNKN